MAKGFKEPKQFKVIGEVSHMGGANVCPLNAPILAIARLSSFFKSA